MATTRPLPEPRVMPEAVCVGVHVLDVLGGPVADDPPAGQAQLVAEITMSVAGTAGGVAVDLARHGVATATIGVVGDDVAGALLRRLMSDHGIDVDRAPDRPASCRRR